MRLNGAASGVASEIGRGRFARVRMPVIIAFPCAGETCIVNF
jgi:hypothetical protein